jgi:hypothetical protein
MATGDPVALKHIHVYSRPQQDDILFGWATRENDTDALFQWDGNSWVEIFVLPYTNAIYDSVTWLSIIFFCDGKTGIWAYDFENNTICLIEDGPVVQYLVTFQDRLIGAGDSRTEAEVLADSQIWPADSNRDRVLFTETLDFNTWSPNNFIDARTGTGEVISGLGVNSITSATRGAQSQLVVFKPTAILINDGALASGEQKLNFVSLVVGCPGYHSIVNTPFGLFFVSKSSVCMMNTDAKEPDQVGFPIHTEIEAIPEDLTNIYTDLKHQSAGVYHDNTLKFSICDGIIDTDRNTVEWWLDLRQAIFPQERNWYGPHTGDFIMQYANFQNMLVGAEHQTMLMWQLDVEGEWGSMQAPSTARTSTFVTNRVQVPGMKEGKLDAYGLVAQMSAGVDLNCSVDIDRGSHSEANVWTSPSVLGSEGGSYKVIRPIKRPGHDAQVTVNHADASDIEIHTLYMRARERRRQSEKQSGSSQT